MATSAAVATDTSSAAPNAAFAALPSGSVYSPSGRRISDTDPSLLTLSLANGMTAGYGVQDGNNTNPPAHQYTYGGAFKYQPNRVGFIRNLPGTLPSIQGNAGLNPVYALYFIFNPNQIQTGFQVNAGSIPPLYLYGSGGGSSSIDAVNGVSSQIASNSSTSANVPNLTNSQTISWSLIFDRTYDMLLDTNPGENRGVLRDVAALYNLMGTFDTIGATPISTPCQVVFGQTNSGQLWGFTGYISSVNITYGIFRANMIPSRCEVDLQMTCTYVAAAVPGTAAAASSGFNTPANNNNAAAGTPINIGSTGVQVG